MNCSSPCCDGPDSGFFSAATLAPDNKKHEDGTCENVKLRTQLECLKNSLNKRMQDLKVQQELTKDLEDELERTKVDLSSLQEKFDKQERRNKAVTINSLSEPGLNSGYGTLFRAVNKVEATLRSLSQTHGCGLTECRTVIEKEIEKILSVKNDLKCLETRNQSKESARPCTCNSMTTTYSSRKTIEIEDFQSIPSLPEIRSNKCNLLHVGEVENFREKALTGIATLEEMKEQIENKENVIRKYIREFPCDCDKVAIETCEDKLDVLRKEFDEITGHLCGMIQALDEESCNGSSTTCYDLLVAREHQSAITDESAPVENMFKLRCDSERLQKEICEQENEIEKLHQMLRQLEEDCEQKRKELTQQNKDLDTRMAEIIRLKDLMSEISQHLRKNVTGGSSPNVVRSPSECSSRNGLKDLFCAIKDFGCVLETANKIFAECPKLKEDNEKLKNKVVCMEKYISNKEETLKVLQDTIKVKECQIEDFKSKMNTLENDSFKLNRDIEEKCRLISNLQEAVRKCKQFEVNVRSVQVEAMEFKICELNGKLKKSEKELELRDRRFERLQNKILVLSSRNVYLIRELNVIEPRLKSVYKTCHLFEKMVEDLQAKLNARDCEVENLYEKIKDLENELDVQFKKCEFRAQEDSKYIENLNSTLRGYEQELCDAKENCKETKQEAEELLKTERQTFREKECEFKERICQLKREIKDLRSELQESTTNEESSTKISDLECMVREAESRQQVYDKKISDLESLLECTMLEHEEERKNILQKLCEEKEENVKNKTLITKLNENMKQKMMNEKTLKACIERFTENMEILRSENQELKAEVEVRKKLMSAMEKNESPSLTELEELICHLKSQKADAKSRCCNLRAELDKELKLKRLLECRVEDLNSMLENKLQEFEQMVQNYKLTSSKLQQNLLKVKQDENESTNLENELRRELNNDKQLNENECLKKMIDVKTAENAKLYSQLLVMKVEIESLQTEYFSAQANKDSLISCLRHEASCLEKNLQDLEDKYRKLEEDNKRIQGELDCCLDKTTSMQAEFREKQKQLCAKLRTTLSEKNDLLNSVDKLQKQLEHICLENVGKDEVNRELAKECSRLKVNNDANENYIRNKSDKIICNLSKEVKNLQCELCRMKENYNSLNDEYQSLMQNFRAMEKKKLNLEKLYLQVNNENGDLQELKMKLGKELCELKSQNLLLKEKIMASTKNDSTSGNSDENKVLRNKVKELTTKIRTLENRLIPDLEQEIAEKNCCIENMNVEIRDANISSQRMRNEALRVIQHTKKYLAAQRCANDTLKSRLECSNKRGNLLGAENRELEEQLKAVTRMNEFLLCQLENSKSDVEAEPPSCSPLPWSSATVERDTSSSEYLAESGIQSMQQSPTNLNSNAYDFKQEAKRPNQQWNSLKRNKQGEPAEYSPCRSNIR